MNRREKLIHLRKEKEWYQRDVVSMLKKEFRIDITESYYGMIEQGSRTPNLKLALAISRLFKVDVQDIFLFSNTTKCCGVIEGPNEAII
jgi:DNA-binding XRE family transcriptional regulator